MTAIEKRAYSQEEGQATVPCRATRGSTRAGQEAERVGGSVGKCLYCGFHRKKGVRQGKLAKQV